MPVVTHCPECSHSRKNAVPGTTVACVNCAHSFVVPGETDEVLCPWCGKQLPEGSTACDSCGTRFDDESQTEGLQQTLPLPCSCGRQYDVPVVAIGLQVQCEACGEILTVGTERDADVFRMKDEMHHIKHGAAADFSNLLNIRREMKKERQGVERLKEIATLAANIVTAPVAGIVVWRANRGGNFSARVKQQGLAARKSMRRLWALQNIADPNSKLADFVSRFGTVLPGCVLLLALSLVSLAVLLGAGLTYGFYSLGVAFIISGFIWLRYLRPIRKAMSSYPLVCPGPKDAILYKLIYSVVCLGVMCLVGLSVYWFFRQAAGMF